MLEAVAATAPEQLTWLCQVLPGAGHLADYCGVEPHLLAGTLVDAARNLDRLQRTRKVWRHPDDVRGVNGTILGALLLLSRSGASACYGPTCARQAACPGSRSSSVPLTNSHASVSG